MRVLLRILAPLLGLVLAAIGVLVVLEVAAAWVRTDDTDGLLVPWPDWRATLSTLSWNENPVVPIAIGVAVFGLLVLLVGLLARRSDVPLDAPSEEMTVTTSPRVLARLIGIRVRATDAVAGASVTASARKISVSARAWDDAPADLRDTVVVRAQERIAELPLHRTPRLAVSVQERRGPR